MSVRGQIMACVGLIGGAISTLFGGWNAGLTTLLIFMAVDYITGLICAGIFHASPKSQTGALDSKAGWKGLCRKGMVLVLVIVAQRIDLLVGTDYVRDGVCIAFTCNELVSIIENAGLMGVPIPKILTNMIDVLKSKEDQQ